MPARLHLVCYLVQQLLGMLLGLQLAQHRDSILESLSAAGSWAASSTEGVAAW
jgi:hypothetical protein